MVVTLWMSRGSCFLRGHDFVMLQAHTKDDPSNPIEGMMMVCQNCGAQRPEWGLLRKGAKLFNQKGQWVAIVEKAAVK